MIKNFPASVMLMVRRGWHIDASDLVCPEQVERTPFTLAPNRRSHISSIIPKFLLRKKI